MRVVMVANWWYPRGGLGRVMFLEAKGLADAGHDVIGFAAQHDENVAGAAAAYLPRFVETADGGTALAPLARLRAAVNIIYNRDAARRFANLLDDWKPDVIHVHNTLRQLSPSILGPAKERGVPAVMTAHDFSLVCPQGLMLKGGRSACQTPNCLGGNVLHAVEHRCLKGSLAVSGLAAVENLAHRATAAYHGRLHSIVVPSMYLEQQLSSGGVPRRLLQYLPNGLPAGPAPEPAPAAGGQVLYLGRLANEKGVDVLLAAATRLPEAAFCIAGDGPAADQLRSTAPGNVRFVGQLGEGELANELAQAALVVSPSICPENAPMAILEAMRAGRAVVATELGGQPELLGETGVIVPAGDSVALAATLAELTRDHARTQRLGMAARDRFVERFTFERHMDGLLGVYRRAIADDADSSVTRDRAVGPAETNLPHLHEPRELGAGSPP